MAVFPEIGNYGHGYEDEGQGFVKVYPDMGWRYYAESNITMTVMPLVISRIVQTRMQAIRSFFNTNKFNQFFVYDPAIVTSVDLSGGSATGRHTALFFVENGGKPKITVRNLGRCIYDVEVKFLLLD